MKLDLQKNILVTVQRVILCMIPILVELNNYLTMGRLVCLGGSLLIMAASFYPLFDLINSFGDVEHKVSTLTVGLILIWLVIALIFGMLLFYFTWQDIIDENEERYDQLHFKGAVYTVPEIYQVKGLHGSSSLHKITNGYQTTPYDSIKQRNYLKINHLGQKEKERQIVGDNGMV